MGTIITVSGANYSANNINNDLGGFDVLSDHVGNYTFNKVSGALAVNNAGATGDYNWLSSSSINSATVTMASSNPILQTVIVGVDTSGNALTLYLDGSGYVLKFPKTGVLGSLNSVYTVSPAPTVAKGSPVTITHSGTSFTISYTGYTKTVAYSSIPNWSYPVIGVLTTGTTANNYTFVIN